ncbi:MAG: M20/M25/M40 family metallo-hydrolase [Nitrospira sp.]|nr:M20/M25/M40 family metallo-hydrolase [Nitrospira sp.]
MIHSWPRSFIALGRMALCLTLALLAHSEPVRAQASDANLQAALNTLSSERMLADIRTLSSASFNGRLAGSDDDRLSAQWVAQELAAAQLHLPPIMNGSLRFPFVSGKQGTPLGVMASIISASTIQPDPSLRMGSADQMTPATLGTDYLPVFDSPSASIQGRIVFVGYGIADPAHGIDDYASVEVTNQIVLFLRGKPDHYQQPVSHADKVRFAKSHGALAYLTATGPILHPYEARRGVTGRPSAFYSQLPQDQAIPGAWIGTALAEQLLAGSDSTNANRLRLLQEQLNNTASSQSRETDRYASLDWNSTRQEGLLTNVVGLIPGTGPDAIIVGAHRDHFGRPAGLFFPGADDNASGTAVMLEVARAIAKSDLRPQHTILFVSFSGEENGLLGSRLYVTRPIVPLASTNVMINIDHAGIGNGRLTVGVTGLEKTVATAAGQAAELTDKLDVYGFFPGGDHVPFKEAGVPTITTVSGGVHPHYHQPADAADTINPDILMTTARYVMTLAWQLANEP